jgi:hypothetical protein
VLSSEKEAPAIAGEGQIAQYGPTVTGIGSAQLAQAVLTKACATFAFVGNLVRQVQRSWLKEVAL